MADRIIIGNKGGSYGIFVSKPGINVGSANEDDLIFNTNNVSAGSFLGAFQLGQVGSTQNQTTQDVTQNAGTSSNQSLQQFSSDGVEPVVEGTDGGFAQSAVSETGSTFSFTTDSSLTIRGFTHTNQNSRSYKIISIKNLW